MEKHKHEKSLICTADSVNAIVARLKRQTQFRRVIKPQPPEGYEWKGWYLKEPEYNELTNKSVWLDRYISHVVKCPYGKPGDTLWVRETWRIINYKYSGTEWEIQYKDGTSIWFEHDPGDEVQQRYFLQCQQDVQPYLYKNDDGEEIIDCEDTPTRWRSPIFMPRWASRLNLLVKNIEVERVQDMTHLDIVEEGFLYFYRKMTAIEKSRFADDIEDQIIYAKSLDSDDLIDDAVIEWYADWWDALNAKRGYSWDSNPWVWKITFDPVMDILDC